MDWQQSGFQIILSLVGSGLFVTFLTTFLSEVYFQPLIDINIKKHSNDLVVNDDSKYFEIHIKNAGMNPALNVKISSFFFSNITKYYAILSGENITVNRETLDSGQISPTSDYIIPSLISANLPRLSPNSLVVMYIFTSPWSDSLSEDNYYVTVTHDKGSDTIVNLPINYGFNKNLNPIFPTIDYDKNSLSNEQLLSIITLILSLIFFIVLLWYRKMRILSTEKQVNVSVLTSYDVKPNKEQKLLDILIIIPITVVIVLVIYFGIDTFFTSQLSLLGNILYFYPFNDITEIRGVDKVSIVVGIIFLAIITIIRTYLIFISYQFIRKLIGKNEKISLSLKNPDSRIFFMHSLIIFGLPIYPLILIFFANLTTNNLNFIIIFIDIIRLFLLFIIIPYFSSKVNLLNILIKSSKIIGLFIGILYISLSMLILSKLIETFGMNMYLYIKSLFSIFPNLYNDLVTLYNFSISDISHSFLTISQNIIILNNQDLIIYTLFTIISLVIVVVAIIRIIFFIQIAKDPKKWKGILGISSSIVNIIFWIIILTITNPLYEARDWDAYEGYYKLSEIFIPTMQIGIIIIILELVFIFLIYSIVSSTNVKSRNTFLKIRHIRFIVWFPILVIILYLGIDFSISNISKITPYYMNELNDILRQYDQYSQYKDVKLVDYMTNHTFLYVPFFDKIYRLSYTPESPSTFYSIYPISFEETPLLYKDLLFNQKTQSFLFLDDRYKLNYMTKDTSFLFLDRTKHTNKEIKSNINLKNIGINENNQQMYGVSQIRNDTTEQSELYLHNLNFDSNITEVQSDHYKLLETGFYTEENSKIIVNPKNNDIYVIYGSKIFVIDENFNIKFTYPNPSIFIDIDVINNEVYLTSSNGLIIIDEFSKIDEIRFNGGLDKISHNYS